MRRGIFVICLTMLLAACADDADEIEGTRTPLPDTGNGLPSVSFSLPEGVAVSERRIDAGARLYDFSLGGRPLLGLYLGPDPSFNPTDGEPEVQIEFVGGLPAKTVTAHVGDQWSRDMLVQSRAPVFYHFFYRNLRDGDLLIADHIIGSLHER
jgi:hypothetical protein